MRLLSFAPILLGLSGSLLAQNGGRGGQLIYNEMSD
jgi:hypothetical protein